MTHSSGVNKLNFENVGTSTSTNTTNSKNNENVTNKIAFSTDSTSTEVPKKESLVQ